MLGPELVASIALLPLLGAGPYWYVITGIPLLIVVMRGYAAGNFGR